MAQGGQDRLRFRLTISMMQTSQSVYFLLLHSRGRTVIRKRLPPALRFALTVVALLAFTFQSYVVQTHIHLVGRNVVALGMATSEARSKPEKFPANQDPSNCPLCQELLHSGNFVAPSAIAALPPALAISTIVIRLETEIAPQPISHSWHGRAPPHLISFA